MIIYVCGSHTTVGETLTQPKSLYKAQILEMVLIKHAPPWSCESEHMVAVQAKRVNERSADWVDSISLRDPIKKYRTHLQLKLREKCSGR